MITLLASFLLGGWTGTLALPPPPLALPPPPFQPNSAVGCDPCKGVRTAPPIQNPPQLVCTPTTAGDSAILGCSSPPITGPAGPQ
jgi:hypothetical protein